MGELEADVNVCHVRYLPAGGAVVNLLSKGHEPYLSLDPKFSFSLFFHVLFFFFLAHN